MMEACSVCPCEESEIPKRWLEEKKKNRSIPDGFGWISDFDDDDENEAQLGRVTVTTSVDASDDPAGTSPSASDREASIELNRLQRSSQGYLSHLHATEDCDTLHNDWTTVEEAADGRSLADVGVYVNLLENPERYTGYSGPPAQRVWTAIAEENCFLPARSLLTRPTSANAVVQKEFLDEQCLETRVFYRLIEGLRASITVHIAREYRHPVDQYTYRWGPHEELFLQHIAPFPDRLQNLYFTFLFLLRAVAKAEPQLLRHTLYDTGDAVADNQLRAQLQALYSFFHHSHLGAPDDQLDDVSDIAVDTNNNTNTSSSSCSSSSNGMCSVSVLAECARAFNESRLFQSPSPSPSLVISSPTESTESRRAGYAGYLDYAGTNEHTLLREEFRLKFRNISRILECVSCEKCRLWSKLQILGLGTAAKVLLTEGAEEVESLQLRRQEVIALVNTLHQLTKSVAFAAHVLATHPHSDGGRKSDARGDGDGDDNVDADDVDVAVGISNMPQQVLCALDPRKSVTGAVVTAVVCLSTLLGYYLLVWRRRTRREEVV
jgi:hypothetical protein